MSEIKQSRPQLQLSMIVFSPSNKVLIDLENPSEPLQGDYVETPQGRLALVEPTGMKVLSRYFTDPVPIYKRVITKDRYARKGRRTESVKVGEHRAGYEAIAANMSVLYPCTPEQAKELIEPLVRAGMPRIWLATFYNAKLGVSNGFEKEKYPEWFEKYGSNKWIASGNLNDLKPDYKEVNRLLKARGSTIRVRTPSLFMTRVLSDI